MAAATSARTSRLALRKLRDARGTALQSRRWASSLPPSNDGSHPEAPASYQRSPSQAPRARFTTPDVTPSSSSSAAPALPATSEHPVEDYASPTLYVGSLFSRAFRGAVFASCGLVLLLVGSVGGVHAWVEYVELAAPTSGKEDDFEWAEEGAGWSGGHRGGGTDPRLGVLARFAVRSAWMAQHWGTGSRASSPVAAGLGRPAFGVIPAREVRDLGPTAHAPEWGWAEAYLVSALERAARKGITLQGADADGVVDRAPLELEQRLATLRELQGGLEKLEEARDGWARAYYALSSVNGDEDGWTQRERMKTARKMGDLSARLAELYVPGSIGEQREKKAAEGWLWGGVVAALATSDAIKNPPAAAAEPKVDSKKVASPSSAFFGFWSRSHPPSSSSAPTSSPLPVVALAPTASSVADHLHALSFSAHEKKQRPSDARALLTSLTALETFLARSRRLPEALELQSASLELVRAFSLEPEQGPTDPDYVSTDRLLASDKADRKAGMQQLWLTTRAAILATHRGEVLLAMKQKQEGLEQLEGAMGDCEKVLKALEGTPLLLPATGWKKLRGGKEEALLRGPARGVERDARVAGGMAAKLSAVTHESSSAAGKSWTGKSKKEEGGGKATAGVYWKKALEFAGGKGRDTEAEKGVRRCEEAVKLARVQQQGK